MRRTYLLFSRLHDLEGIDSIRAEIIGLMFDNLEVMRDTLDDWERMHFANAIGALALNMNAVQQPTNAWLRLCIQDLEHALMPKTERDQKYILRSKSIEPLTYEQLVDALNALAIKIAFH